MTKHNLQDKFLLYLNSSLAMENAALERVCRRAQQTILEDARQQLQHHLEETKEQQDRLRTLITKIGGKPTQEKGKLPISMPPESITSIMDSSMTSAEEELIQSVEDTIVENAEVTGYNLLIQIAGKLSVAEAIPLLKQSLQEEEKMVWWLKANAPAMFAKLWPQIESQSSSSSSTAEMVLGPGSYSNIKTTTEDVAGINQSFRCESCNEKFNSREDLRQHTIHKHESRNMNGKKNDVR
jgi:ferritin-like metal-binding protein YciE